MAKKTLTDMKKRKSHVGVENKTCHYCGKTATCWEILGERLYYQICRKHKKIRINDGFKKCVCGEIFHPQKHLGNGGYCKLCRLTMQLGSPVTPHSEKIIP